jgi:hypothetical protein
MERGDRALFSGIVCESSQVTKGRAWGDESPAPHLFKCLYGSAFRLLLHSPGMSTQNMRAAMHHVANTSIENAMADGDNCARALPLDMLLAAAHGMDAIPAAWHEGWLARQFRHIPL